MEWCCADTQTGSPWHRGANSHPKAHGNDVTSVRLVTAASPDHLTSWINAFSSNTAIGTPCPPSFWDPLLAGLLDRATENDYRQREHLRPSWWSGKRYFWSIHSRRQWTPSQCTRGSILG